MVRITIEGIKFAKFIAKLLKLSLANRCRGSANSAAGRQTYESLTFFTSKKNLFFLILVSFFLFCCRFHLLSEFDEGKRSCRRRLAGHNRRRRKTTHPEEVASGGLVVPGNRDNNTSNANMDLMALLTALACAQGTDFATMQ